MGLTPQNTIRDRCSPIDQADFLGVIIPSMHPLVVGLCLSGWLGQPTKGWPKLIGRGPWPSRSSPIGRGMPRGLTGATSHSAKSSWSRPLSKSGLHPFKRGLYCIGMDYLPFLDNIQHWWGVDGMDLWRHIEVPPMNKGLVVSQSMIWTLWLLAPLIQVYETYGIRTVTSEARHLHWLSRDPISRYAILGSTAGWCLVKTPLCILQRSLRGNQVEHGSFQLEPLHAHGDIWL